METKPYSLQSPEQIAKDYGGNKQKIAEAMQLGIVDPTAGTLAAMFIDRMRSAAQAEAVPQQSVAQQVFAPPAPPAPQMPMGEPQMPMGEPQEAPAGLGATPEAVGMPMPAGAPPMGMPSPQPVPGMAMGGMVPPYMSGGGLSDLPLPDDMFDENRNGGFNDGYRGGGLVAFNIGGIVDPEDDVFELDEVSVEGRRSTPLPPPEGPLDYYGFLSDPVSMGERIDELAPQSTTRRAQLNTYLDRLLNPEDQKKRRKEDMWMALGQIGARMATTPGSLLQAASTGIAEALPGVRAAASERRAEERGALAELARNEGLTNAEARERYRLIMQGTDRYGGYNEGRISREVQERLAIFEQKQANWRAGEATRAAIEQARISAGASRDVANIGSGAASDRAFADFMASSTGITAFTRLVASGVEPAAAIAILRRDFLGAAPAPSVPAAPAPAPRDPPDRIPLNSKGVRQ